MQALATLRVRRLAEINYRHSIDRDLAPIASCLLHWNRVLFYSMGRSCNIIIIISTIFYEDKLEPQKQNC